MFKKKKKSPPLQSFCGIHLYVFLNLKLLLFRSSERELPLVFVIDLLRQSQLNFFFFAFEMPRLLVFVFGARRPFPLFSAVQLVVFLILKFCSYLSWLVLVFPTFQLTYQWYFLKDSARIHILILISLPSLKCGLLLVFLILKILLLLYLTFSWYSNLQMEKNSNIYFSHIIFLDHSSFSYFFNLYGRARSSFLARVLACMRKGILFPQMRFCGEQAVITGEHHPHTCMYTHN